MKHRTRKQQPLSHVSSKPDAKRLLGDIRELIQKAREHTARAIDTGMAALYWSIGERIRRDTSRRNGRTTGR
jgi:hypothetical protein